MPVFREAFRAEAVALALTFVSLLLLALPEPTQQGLARRANHLLLLPLSQVRETFGGYLRLRSENARLREELQRTRIELSATRAMRLQNRELQRLLGFEGGQPVRLLPARVIDRNFGTLPTTFLVDVGRDDGVTESLPVVTDRGLVGKTAGVGAESSQVLLYSHPDFSASALLVGGDHLEYGIVRPSPGGELELYLPLRSSSERGDRIVTSGYGGTFPRGIPIGIVDRFRQDQQMGLQRIDLLTPAVDLGSVTTVFVLRRVPEAGSRRQAAPGAGESEGVDPAGEVMRLFWPGYAYPPMAGESFGGVDSTPPDTAAPGDSARAAFEADTAHSGGEPAPTAPR